MRVLTRNMLIGFVVFALLLTTGGILLRNRFDLKSQSSDSVASSDYVNLSGQNSEEPKEDNGTLQTIRYGDGVLRTSLIGSNQVGSSADYWIMCFFTDALKANTNYKLYWSFNSGFLVNTRAELVQQEFDGIMKYVLHVDSSYEAGQGIGTRMVTPYLSEILCSSWNFTSEAEGDVFSFATVRINVTDYDEAVSIAKEFLTYVNYVTIQEVGETT